MMSRNRLLLLACAGFLVAWWALSSAPIDEGRRDSDPEVRADVAHPGRTADAIDARGASARGDRRPADSLPDEEMTDTADAAAEAPVGAEARWDAPPRARRERPRREAPVEAVPQIQIDSNPPAELAAPEFENARALARQAAVAPTPEISAPVVPVEPDGAVPEVLYDSGDDMQFRSEEQVEVARPGKIVGPSGTISFDLSPQWDASVGYADFVALGDNVRVTKLSDYLQFEIIDAGGARHVVSTKVDAWEPNEAQEIAATWDERTLQLYVNGRMVAADALEHPIQIADDASLRIGSRYPDGRPIAAATISRVSLRDEFFVPPAPVEPVDGP